MSKSENHLIGSCQSSFNVICKPRIDRSALRLILSLPNTMELDIRRAVHDEFFIVTVCEPRHKTDVFRNSQSLQTRHGCK